MLCMATKNQNPMSNIRQSDAASNNINPQDPGKETYVKKGIIYIRPNRADCIEHYRLNSIPTLAILISFLLTFSRGKLRGGNGRRFQDKTWRNKHHSRKLMLFGK